MALSDNPYHVLQLEQAASYEQVRERYLMLSKIFHPDKQPNANYGIAKAYFFQIDWAFKALSNPLRRYIYEQFGLQGIQLLEKYPHDFQPYAATIQYQTSQDEVRELMFYLQFVKEVDVEEELTKTECVTYISAVDANNPKSYRFGKNQSHTISFSSTVPEVGQFQNTLEMDIENTFGRQPQTMFRCYSNRRIWNGYFKDVLVRNSFLVWKNGVSEQLNFSKNISDRVILKFSPLILEGWSLQRPKIGIQKNFENDVNFQAETNGGFLSMELGKSTDRTSKHINFEFFENMFNVNTGYEMQLNRSTRVIAGVMLSGSHADRNLNMFFGYYYGLRLLLTPELKIDIRSVFGQHNHLDLRISKGKYNIRVPIFSEGLDVAVFETLKLTAILVVYFVHTWLGRKARKTKTRRQRLLDRNYVRLTEDRSKLMKMCSEANEADRSISAFEIKSKGLVILKALYGSKSELKPIAQRLSREKLVPSSEGLESVRNDPTHDFSDNDSEIYDITKLVQIAVVGAQLKNYLPKGVPNPCIDSQQKPQLFIFYSLRSQVCAVWFDLKSPINIGVPSEPKANNLLARIQAWIGNHLM